MEEAPVTEEMLVALSNLLRYSLQTTEEPVRSLEDLKGKRIRMVGYMVLDGHNQIPELQMISQAIWRKLAVADQDIVSQQQS